MKAPFLPPPSDQVLAGSRVHELIRDYPELLPHLRRMGMQLEEDGAVPLPGDLVADTPEAEGIRRSLAWRGGAGP